MPFRAVKTRRPPLIRQPMGVKQLVVLAPYRHGVNDLYVEILPYFCCPQADWGQIMGPIHSIHPKAMPIVLTTREVIDVWMNAPAADVLKLQRPLADNTLKIVARETKRTGAASRSDVHRRCDYAAT